MDQRDEISHEAYRAHLREADAQLQGRLATGAGTITYHAPTPILGVALHASGELAPDLLDRMAISREARRFEEDPGTDRFLSRTTHRLVAEQSRYEVDLNRPPDTAMYTSPEMAWGVQVWETPPSPAQRERVLEKWYAFHTAVDAAVADAIERFGRCIVLDLHSYNYQRDGPRDWRTDGKPVINLGTGHLRLDDEGAQLKEWFFQELQGHTYLGEEMAVAENQVFQGGYLNRRLSRTFGPRCLTFSIEYKKVFMDPEAQVIDEAGLRDLIDQFDATVEALAERIGAPLPDPPVPTP